MAGVAPFLRPLSARSSAADLWAGVDALCVEGRAIDRLQRRTGVRLDNEARRRYAAFVAQARQYFETLPTLDPVAKPLLGYYFALNLAKAFLTTQDPGSTQAGLSHGLKEAKEQKARYYFQQEGFRIQDRGVFRLLAERTGQGFCYAAGYRLPVTKLLPYLPDGFDLYADVADEAPKLLPVIDIQVLFRGKEGWLRVEIDRNTLRQRNIGPESLPRRARIFGTSFHLVSSDEPTASYESVTTFPYPQRRVDVLPDLCTEYDRSLIASQRNVAGGRRYVVLSERLQLLSHEAVTFAVLHHLSNMVRYRPQHVERLRGTPFFWLFTSWVDRACENFLLGLSSRITNEEHIVI